MKAGIIVVIIVILLAGFAAFYILNKQPETSVSTIEPAEVAIEDTQTIDSNLSIGSDSSNQKLSGNYITGMAADAYKYSQADKIVLFFYANWCPTCRPVDTEFKENIQKIPAGVEIYRINYNDPDTDAEEKALAQKYGIAYQHTFIELNDKGDEIKRWNGGGLNKIINEVNKQPSPSPFPPEKRVNDLF